MERTTKGFTLIELLVVIAIIGVLSSIIINNLVNARYKAQDAKVKQQRRQVQLSIELYYNENNRYPSTATPGFYCIGSTTCKLAGASFPSMLSSYTSPSYAYKPSTDFTIQGDQGYIYDTISNPPRVISLTHELGWQVQTVGIWTLSQYSSNH